MNDGRAAEADRESVQLPDEGALALAVAPSPPWPSEVPSADEALAEIGAALAAGANASPLAARVARDVSEIERSAFQGMSLADPPLLRAAAGLRLRLATALATAPERGELDDAAAQELLANADEILTALSSESAQANELVAAALGTVRTELVRDAIRVSEAQQRLATPAPEPLAPGPRAAPRVRVLSNESDTAEGVVEKRRRNLGLWLTFAVAVLAAGGYHAERLLRENSARARMVRVDGAPERILATPQGTGGQLLYTPPGAPLTSSELQQLRAAQRARGREVVERAAGIYVLQKIGSDTRSTDGKVGAP